MVLTSSIRQKQQLLSKIATNDGHGENSSYFDGWKAYDSDPFHPTRNPNGVIQMGLAENQVFSILDSSILQKKDSIFDSLLTYIFLDIYFFFFGSFLQLSFDLIRQWVKNNPEASICTAEGIHNFQEIAIFQDYHGLPEFRNVINLKKTYLYFLPTLFTFSSPI